MHVWNEKYIIQRKKWKPRKKTVIYKGKIATLLCWSVSQKRTVARIMSFPKYHVQDICFQLVHTDLWYRAYFDSLVFPENCQTVCMVGLSVSRHKISTLWPSCPFKIWSRALVFSLTTAMRIFSQNLHYVNTAVGSTVVKRRSSLHLDSHKCCATTWCVRKMVYAVHTF